MFALYQETVKPKDSPLMTRVKGQQVSPYSVIDAVRPKDEGELFKDVEALRKCINEIEIGLTVIATRNIAKRGKPSSEIRLKDGCLIASVEVAGEVRELINGY